MITRHKDNDTGNYLKVEITKSTVFDSVKKESALFAKMKRTESGDPVFDEAVITDDETKYFDDAFQRVILILANLFKDYGLDRNDLTPIENRDIYFFQTINTTEQNGVISGSPEIATYYLNDTGKAGHNVISNISDYVDQYLLFHTILEIYERMRPEFAEYFMQKSILSTVNLEHNIFYIV